MRKGLLRFGMVLSIMFAGLAITHGQTYTLSPPNNATDVSINPILTITFDAETTVSLAQGENIYVAFDDWSSNITLSTGKSVPPVPQDPRLIVSGNTLNIDLSTTDLAYSQNYIVYADQGAILVDGETWNDLLSDYPSPTWSFTTESIPPPSIVSYSPGNNAPEVPLDMTLTLTFEKGIQFNPSGTFSIDIFSLTGGESILFERFEIVNGTPPVGVSILDNQIFIDPSRNFDYETNYYINIENNLIQSTEGVPFGGISENYIWNFTTEAAQPPSITSFSPENSATGVPVDFTLTLTFDKPILFNPSDTFNIAVFTPNDPDSILFEEFEIIDGNSPGGVSIVDNQLFIQPSGDFDYETDYYLIIESGSIQSTEGAPFGGITNNAVWSFTTEALTPPSIVSLAPGNNDKGVLLDATLTLTFDVNVKANPLTSTPAPAIYVKRKADEATVLEYTVSEGIFKKGSEPTNEVSISGTDLVINPPDDFDYSTEYYVTIDNGALYPAPDDTNLHPFAGFSDDTTWSFTTVADPDSPAIITSIPDNNATGVSVGQTLTLTFDGDIKANPLTSTPAIYVKRKADDFIALEYTVSEGEFSNSGEISISGPDLVINPPDDFDYSTEYYVTIESGCLYLDSDGTNSHPFAGFLDDTTWSFTTEADPDSPSINSFSPINNATDVPIDASLTLTFDGDIKANPLSSSPAICVKRKADDFIVLEYTVSGGAFSNTNEISISGTDLVINPPTSFDYSTEYYVTIENGCLYPANDGGNSHPFAGFSDNSTWSFTTGVNPDSPILDSTTPINEATHVPLNQDLTITFDKNIQAGSSGVMIIYRMDDSNFQSFNANDPSLSYSGNRLTIPVNDFEPGTSYYVLIDEGFVESTGGAPFAGILDKTEWYFTAADSPIPIAFSPLDDATDVLIDQNLIITFDRDIVRGGISYMTIFNEDGSEYMIISSRESSRNYSISGNQLIINRDPFVFEYDSAYYVKIDPGFVESASGTPFTGISDSTIWNFKTQRSGPEWAPDYPYLSGQDADYLTLNGQTDSGGEYFFVITGSPEKPTPQQIETGKDENGENALITGSGSMTANEAFSPVINIFPGLGHENSYYLHVVTKNQTGSYSESRVRSIDRISPTLYPQSVPRNGATNVPIDIVINIHFSEKIFALDGTEISTSNASNYFDLRIDNSSVSHNIEVSTNGRSITISPTGDLLENTVYEVSMPPFEDQYGNEQAQSSRFTFETDKLNRWSGGGDAGIWEDQNNWDDGNYVSGKSVLIPSTATAYPTLETGAEVNVFHMTLEAGASLTHTGGTLNVGGRFTLKSSTDRNASYLPQGGALNVTADSVFIEQVVTSDTRNYNVSSPVIGATKASMGVTGNMYYFHNPTGSYVLQDNEAPLEAGKGYIFRNSTDVVFTGIPHSAPQTVNVVRTANQGLGWNLIGNPFSATLNWDNVSEKNNIEDSFWLWLNDQSTYSTYNGFVGLGTITDSPDIPSNQCVWVKVVTGLPNNTGSVVFPTSALMPNTRSYLKSGSNGSTRYPSLKLATKMTNYTDITALALAPEATTGIDVFDSDKFFSNNPDLCEVFMLAGNQPLAINGLPEAKEMEIPLGYSALSTGACEFSIALNTLPKNSEVFIKDKTLNTLTKITEDIPYPFEISATGKNTSRFALVLKIGTVTGIEDESFDKDINKPYIYTGKSEIIVHLPEGQQSRYQLFDLNGRVIDNGLLSAGTENRIAVSHKGMVVLRVEWEEGIEEFKAVF